MNTNQSNSLGSCGNLLQGASWPGACRDGQRLQSVGGGGARGSGLAETSLGASVGGRWADAAHSKQLQLAVLRFHQYVTLRAGLQPTNCLKGDVLKILKL